MFRIITLSFSVMLCATAYGENTVNSQMPKEPTSSDLRQLVTMPEQARELMRQDMLDHLLALNEILAYLADNNLEAAATVAETRMGYSTMGKYRASGVGPGKFMPPEMHGIGMSMHAAATEFGKIAQTSDIKAAYGALQKLTSTCVACHYSYRTR